MVLNADDRRSFAEAFRRLAPLTEREVDDGLALFRVRKLVRGQHLLSAGEPASDVVVVVAGLLREYFRLGQEPGPVRARAIGERTKAFVVPGQLSGSLADLLSESPSRAFIVAEEPSRVLSGSYAGLRALGERSAAWTAVGRAALETLLTRKAVREWELLGLDAEARYLSFRARFGGLEASVAARHVASYLGITPVHLSRLRRRLRERARSTREK